MEIKYRINNISEIEYSLNYDIKDDIVKENVSFEISHREKAIKERKEIIVEVFTQLHDDSNNILAKNGIRASFGLEPFSEAIVSTEDDSLTTNVPEVIDTFISISIGALRGILSKNLKGTPLDGCVLPMIPMSLIKRQAKRVSK